MGRPKGSLNKGQTRYNYLTNRLKEPFGDECVEWPFYRNPKGYGIVGPKLAHRIALTLTVGTCPDGMEALHLCDNPPCFNPNHLEWGLHKNNLKGSYDRGKVYPLYGELGYSAKLREVDIKLYLWALGPWLQCD